MFDVSAERGRGPAACMMTASSTKDVLEEMELLVGQECNSGQGEGRPKAQTLSMPFISVGDGGGFLPCAS